jgi:RNA polymerase sigma factor (sigma-70 family)
MKIFLILLFIPFTISFLTLYKWNIIKNIITHNETSSIMKNNAKKIIFIEYYNWTKKQTYIFIKNNPLLVKKIKFHELNMYALSGLLKAIDKYDYNYTSKFSNYALLYIKSDLYKGISDLKPMKLLPHKYRVNKNWKINNTLFYKKTMKNIKFVGFDEWILENNAYDKSNNNYNIKNNKINEINNIISTLNPNLKRIFYYRYDKNMNIKFKIKKISELMCVSTETIRKSLNIIKKELKSKIKNDTFIIL